MDGGADGGEDGASTTAAGPGGSGWRRMFGRNRVVSCVVDGRRWVFRGFESDGEEETRPLLQGTPGMRGTEDGLVGWRAVLEEFTGSRNWFKEIHMAKEIPWDYEQLKTALVRAIRWTGYPHDIAIRFIKQGYKVSAYSPSLFSKASQSSLVKVLCILSCLWVVALPVYSITRKKVQGRLQCVYPMMWGGQEFYERNAAQLVEAVRLGMKRVTLTAV
ncbi:hypothetical protein HDU96_009872 [Phlyctochytrium bullatum]|nr:hypothetical protein HDU96_009872 [Phlyctochytrium bullatum]